MPTYVSLIKWTDQGIKGVRETTTRAEQASAAAQRLGGRISLVLWTQGTYDLVAVTEFPSEEAAQAFLLQTGTQGHIRTETLRAFSAAEMQRILDQLP